MSKAIDLRVDERRFLAQYVAALDDFGHSLTTCPACDGPAVRDKNGQYYCYGACRQKENERE